MDRRALTCCGSDFLFLNLKKTATAMAIVTTGPPATMAIRTAVGKPLLPEFGSLLACADPRSSFSVGLENVGHCVGLGNVGH